MTSLFIVTSAIHTDYGECVTKDRIEQTRKTLESIKTYAPDSSVVIIDCGNKCLDNCLFDCEVINYASHDEIQYHCREFLNTCDDLDPSIILKSMLEIMMFGNFLKNKTGSYERIFKISGRYKLNSNFNYSTHLEAKDKVVILQPRLSDCIYRSDVKVTMMQYMTRCWSFDSSLLLEIIQTFDKMKKDVLYASKTRKQTDIEHLLYKNLKKKFVKTIDVMGVEGYWAPAGVFLKE